MTDENENQYRLKDQTPEPAAGQYYQPPAPVYIPATPKADKPKRSLIAAFFRFIFKVLKFGFYAMGILLLCVIVGYLSGSIVNTEVIQPGDKFNQIAVINLDGLIDMNNASRFNHMLNTAENDSSVKAVIISVNSPGGMVVPADMMAHSIQLFKQRSAKPVYVSVQQISASGAYWATAACDKIFAQTNSMVGSIGVIYSTFVVKDTLDKIGITPITVKSSKSHLKDMGSIVRMPTDEELFSIQHDLDTVHDRFIDVVANGRMLARDSVLTYATGEVFDGPESLEAGLIDQIGFLDDVISSLASELNVHDPQVIRLSPLPTFKQMLTSSQAAFNSGLDLRQQYLDLATQPKIQALWTGQ